MRIWDTLSEALRWHAGKAVVVDGDRRFTYREAAARAGALARLLRAQGIRRGDRVSILDVNSAAFFEAYYACAGLGAVLNPINHRLSPREIAFIVSDAGSRRLIAGPAFASLAAEILSRKTPLEGAIINDYEKQIAAHAGPFDPEPAAEDDAAHLYYTSGTTGIPKGVVLTHRNVCRHAEGAIEELRLAASDVWGHFAPMFHLADAWAAFAVTRAGGTHVMLPRFDAAAALSAIERERVTITNLIPSMLNRMVRHPRVKDFDLSSLRVIMTGGAPIAPEAVRRAVETLGCDYIQTYGMTETSPYLTLSLLRDHLRKLPPEEQLRYKSRTGRPFITVEIKVVDEQGNPVAPDDRQVGEIWVRGETVTPGYWKRPEETKAAFHGGWLKTGDLAVVDAEGYVNIVDRKKDMIISGGENIYCVEVENVLRLHPKVLEAAVVGVPDETWGEAAAAAVVLVRGKTATEEEIRAFCRGRLAAFKAPKRVVFLPQLPRTGSGKVAKKPLRNLLRGRGA